MAATAVTLNDLEGHSPVAGLFKCNSSNICTAFYTMSTDSVLGRFVCISRASCMDRVMEQITSMAMCSELLPPESLTSALAPFASNPKTQSNSLRRIMSSKAVLFCAISYIHCTHSRISYALADINNNFEKFSEHAKVNEIKNTFSNIKLFSA